MLQKNMNSFCKVRLRVVIIYKIKQPDLEAEAGWGGTFCISTKPIIFYLPLHEIDEYIAYLQ